MVDPDDVDIRRLTYTQADFNPTLFHLDRLINRMTPLSNLMGQVPQTKRLGKLTVLPAEILRIILEQLSIPQLMQFRHCNRFSCHLVDTHPLLRFALRIAPNTVRGMMAIRLTAQTTLQQLHHKLYQRYCDQCGQLAPYIYLPTCLRACFTCVRPGGTNMFWYPVPEVEAIVGMGFSIQELATVPSFLFLPATFTNGLNKFKQEGIHRLYDADTLEKMRLGNPVSRSADAKRFWKQNHDLHDFYTAMDCKDPGRADLTVVRDSPSEILRIHMCTVFAPWVEPITSHAEHGSFCSSCLYTDRQYQAYTEISFLEHLKYCRVGPFEETSISDQEDECELSLVEDSAEVHASEERGGIS